MRVGRVALQEHRARTLQPSMYTNTPKRPRTEHAQGRSATELSQQEYQAICAVISVVWHHIQQPHFRERFDAETYQAGPPKAYSEQKEFQQYVYKKLKPFALQPHTHEDLWNALWAILHRAWDPQPRAAFPQCGWKGWYVTEREWEILESSTRHTFPAGFGLVSPFDL